MAKFYLINSVLVGTAQHFAGALLDDAVDNTTVIAAAGGVLWPSSDAAVAAAAAVAQDARKKGRPLETLDQIMMAALGGREKGGRRLDFVKAAADGAASTATAESVIYQAKDAQTITALDIVPAAALTGDNTNNATILIQRRSSAGTLIGTVASLTTNVASGNWVQWVAKSMGTITNGALNPGDFLTLSITKGGTGVVVPQSLFVATVF